MIFDRNNKLWYTLGENISQIKKSNNSQEMKLQRAPNLTCSKIVPSTSTAIQNLGIDSNYIKK